VLERGSLRYTPAGMPVIEFRLAHTSEQCEAGVSRRVECELDCLTIGTTAQLMKDVGPGTALTVSGFIAARSLKRKTPVLHVVEIEFIEKI